jgi:hypothetical protein
VGQIKLGEFAAGSAFDVGFDDIVVSASPA